MNEHEWLTSQQPDIMIRHLRAAEDDSDEILDQHGHVAVSSRKFNQIIRALKPNEKKTIYPLAWLWGWITATLVASEKIHLADLFREIIGNPFRKITYRQLCSTCQGRGEWKTGKNTAKCMWCEMKGYHAIAGLSPDWLTADVRAIAKMIDRHATFSDLPYLADALEEAGAYESCVFCGGKGFSRIGMVKCDGEGIHDTREDIRCVACDGRGQGPSSLLDHLRSPGPHVRGCWALDLVHHRK